MSAPPPQQLGGGFSPWPEFLRIIAPIHHMTGVSQDPKPAEGGAVRGLSAAAARAAGDKQAREHGESGAGGYPQQKMIIVCEEATAGFSRRVLSPPVSAAHVDELLGELDMENTETAASSCSDRKPGGNVSSKAPGAHSKGGSVEAGCKSLVLTVQVKANGKLNFFEGQGPAATLLAQAEMAYGSVGGGGGGGGECPGALLPFISLLDSETVCEVLSDSECSAPPILDSGAADRGNAKAQHVRAASVLAGPHAYPAVRR